MYMGRGGLDGLFGNSSGPITHPVTNGAPPINRIGTPGVPGGGSVGPVPAPGGPFTGSGTSASPPSPPPGSVLGAQGVRATGDPKGYDPSYLQNLATAIGGLFSHSGNMSLNPLGNLSEVSQPSGQIGNAPAPGAPMTWLQQALNGLGFSWPPKPPNLPDVNRRVGGNSGAGDNGRGRGGRMFNLQ